MKKLLIAAGLISLGALSACGKAHTDADTPADAMATDNDAEDIIVEEIGAVEDHADLAEDRAADADTPEERARLEEHADQLDARADRLEEEADRVD